MFAHSFHCCSTKQRLWKPYWSEFQLRHLIAVEVRESYIVFLASVYSHVKWAMYYSPLRLWEVNNYMIFVMWREQSPLCDLHSVNGRYKLLVPTITKNGGKLLHMKSVPFLWTVQWYISMMHLEMHQIELWYCYLYCKCYNDYILLYIYY